MRDTMKWLKIMSIFLTCNLFLTACWDLEDIEDIGIVVGVGLDVVENNEHDRPNIDFTHQFVVPKALAGEQGGSSGLEDPYHNVSVNEIDVFEGGRETSTLTSRSPNYAHLKIAVIHEEVAETINLLNLLNFFFRDHEMRRTARVIVSAEDAKEILDIKGKKDAIPSLKLYQMTRNMEYKTGKMPPSMNLGEISELLSSNRSFMIQRVKKMEDEVQIIGAGVISGKSKMMVGLLNEDETFGMNCITGNASAGIITATHPKSDALVSYEIDGLSSKITPMLKGDQLSFHVKVNTEGRIGEDWKLDSDAFEEAYIQKLETLIGQELKRLMTEGINKTQKELRVDVAGFGEEVRIHEPRYWEKVKKNWDKTFEKSEISFDVSVNIRQFQTRGRKLNPS